MEYKDGSVEKNMNLVLVIIALPYLCDMILTFFSSILDPVFKNIVLK